MVHNVIEQYLGVLKMVDLINNAKPFEQKLSKSEAKRLFTMINGFVDVQYNDKTADAYARINDKLFRFVHNADLSFTGEAYEVI